MIKIEGLKKVFDSRGIAGLHGLDLTISEGEIFSILGPNGSGKSTLLKILNKDLTPDSGIFSVSGNVHLFHPRPPVHDINVQKFLIEQVTADIDVEKKIQLARDLADIFEFTFQLRQNFSQLSSGQSQRILVAAELMNRPQILLFDEPFAHLDPQTRETILSTLFAYLKQQNTTVVWVTHDLKDAFRFSDRIGVLNFGKWEQIGKPNDLLVSPRNLFTARYLGFKNFVVIKHGKDGWTTPWGILDRPPLHAEDAILVLPLQWTVAEHGIVMKVLSRTPGPFYTELSMEAEFGHFFGEFDSSQLEGVGDQIRVVPNLKKSLIISL